MPTTQFGGQIGPFFDNVQQRGVPVTVTGTVDYATAGPVPDPARLDNDVRNQLLRAVQQVIGPKMATGQLQFRNLGEGTIGDADNEIIAASGLPQMGVQVGNLAMRFAIDNGPPQREIRARINVGGFHIQASSTGGVNTAGLANQAINKAKSAIIWYVMAAVIVAAVGFGVRWYITRTVKKALDAPSPTAAAAAKWDGKAPLTCGGADVVLIDGVTAKLTATAINAMGSCNLTLTNVNIDAPTAIQAGGAAIVTVTGGSLTGSTFAIAAGGSAKVTVSGTKVTGKTQKLGSATITGI